MAPFRIRLASHVLRAGGVVAYPTEAVYGLGCDPRNRFAVERLLALKGRPASKGLILVCHRLAGLRPFLADVSPVLESRATETWPGPVTWVWPASSHCPAWITGGRSSVAVRVTAQPIAAALCERFGGAIVSTSANVSARPAARSALGVRRRLTRQPDFILGGPVGLSRRPTGIVDLVSGAVLRSN